VQVDLIDHMGSDLTVVNAARVSFDKHSDELSTQDKRLIRYLADHKHWTPFAHPQLQFRIKAPVFVARQLGKHQIGLVWNEVSRRYVDAEPEAWETDLWRKRAEDKKQGSLEQGVASQGIVDYMYKDAVRHATDAYKGMIKLGVCPEQARAVLPQSVYTEWYWTGSLYAFSRVCALRLKPDAQLETREIAEKIDEHCLKAFPVSWSALSLRS